MFKKFDTSAAYRSMFLVNKPFQFKYAIWLALLGCVIALLFIGHIFYFMNENIQVFLPNFKENPAIYDIVMGELKKIAIYLFSLTFLLGCVLFFLGIIVTHKITGPILVIKKKMDALADGNFDARVSLRKGDEFQDLADSFNNMANALEEKFEELKKGE